MCYSGGTTDTGKVGGERRAVDGLRYDTGGEIPTYGGNSPCTAVAGAVSTGLVWPNLRNITVGGNDVFGAHLMPHIAAIGYG